MFPPGHFGIVMILFAPIAYVLVVRNLKSALIPGLVTTGLLTLALDLDALVPGFVHRGLTHTVFAAGCLGVMTAVLWYVGPRGSHGNSIERTTFGFAIGSLSVISHLLGDVVTPMGIQPFLPFNRTVYTLSLVYSRNVMVNLALFGIGLTIIMASTRLARFTVPPGRDSADESSVGRPLK